MSEGQPHRIPRRPVPPSPHRNGHSPSTAPSVRRVSSLTDTESPTTTATNDPATPNGLRPREKEVTATVETTKLLVSPTASSRRLTTVSGLSLWSLEGGSLLLAIGVLAAIFATLANYQNNEYPSWAYDINLNFIVAIFTIVLRALLLVPLGQVISQGKWSWFREPHPIRDLETFDSASRSAWGSVQLLFLTWRPNMATISALVILMSFAIGPLAQQAVRTDLCQIPVPSQTARIPIAPSADSSLVIPQFKRMSPYWMLTSTIAQFAPLRGLLTVSGDQVPSPQFDCPTANCTFPDVTDGISYSSLGFCSKCYDQTHLIREEGATTSGMIKYAVPGWTLNNATLSMSISGPLFDQAPVIRSTSYTSSTDSVDSHGVQMMFLSAHDCEVQIDDTGNKSRICSQDNLAEGVTPVTGFNLFAVECAISMCVKHYKGEVINNILTEEIVATSELYSVGTQGYFGLDPSTAAGGTEAALKAGAAVNNYTAVRFPCYANNGIKYTSENISEYAGAITGYPCWDAEGRVYDTDKCSEHLDTDLEDYHDRYKPDFPYNCQSPQSYPFFKTGDAVPIGSKDDIVFNNTEQGGVWAVAPPECSFWAPEKINDMGSTIGEEFYGQCTASVLLDGYFMPPWEDNNCYYDTNANNTYSWTKGWLAMAWAGGNATLESIATLWDNMALSGTNALRDKGMQISTTQQRAYAQGTALKTTLCVRFDARWLILAAGMVAITTALLLGAMVETAMVLRQRRRARDVARPPTWKSSLLPLLFHGLVGRGSEEATRSRTTDGMGGPMELHDLNEVTKDMVVRWRRDGDADGSAFGLVEQPKGKK